MSSGWKRIPKETAIYSRQGRSEWRHESTMKEAGTALRAVIEGGGRQFCPLGDPLKKVLGGISCFGGHGSCVALKAVSTTFES